MSACEGRFSCFLAIFDRFQHISATFQHFFKGFWPKTALNTFTYRTGLLSDTIAHKYIEKMYWFNLIFFFKSLMPMSACDHEFCHCAPPTDSPFPFLYKKRWLGQRANELAPVPFFNCLTYWAKRARVSYVIFPLDCRFLDRLRRNWPPSADTLATLGASITECFGRSTIGKHQQSVENLEKPPKPNETLKKCQKLGLRSNWPPSADTSATFRASITECFGRSTIGKHQQSVENLEKPPKPNETLKKCQKLGLRSNWPPSADTSATFRA